MFSWFLSPTITASDDGGVVGADPPPPAAVASGFHPIELPASPNQEDVAVPRPRDSPAPVNHTTASPASLFGGLAVGTRRKRPARSPVIPPTGSSVGPSKEHSGSHSGPHSTNAADVHDNPTPGTGVPGVCSQNVERPAAAFTFLPRRGDSGTEAAMSAPRERSGRDICPPPPDSLGVDEEEWKTTSMRCRLEAFYRMYNRAKLPDVDATVARYTEREEELFTALVRKYGPEPTGLQEKHLCAVAGNTAVFRGCHAHPSESGLSAFSFLRAAGPTAASKCRTPTPPVVSSVVPAVPSRSSVHSTDTTPVSHSRSIPSDEIPVAERGHASDATPTESIQRARLSGAVARLAVSMHHLCSGIEARASVADGLVTLQARLDGCVAAENYGAADVASKAIDAAAEDIADLEAGIAGVASSIPRDVNLLRGCLGELNAALAESERAVLERTAAAERSLIASVDCDADLVDTARRALAEADTAATAEEDGCLAATVDIGATLSSIAEARSAERLAAHSGIRDTEAAVSSLTAEITDLEARLAALRQRRDEATDLLVHLTEAADGVDRSHAEAVATLEEECRALEERPRQARRRVAQLLEDLRIAEAEVARRRGAAEEQQEAILQLRQRATSLLDISKVVRADMMPALSAVMDAVRHALTAREDSRLILPCGTETHNATATSLSESLARSEAEVTRLKGVQETLNAVLSEARDQLPVLEAGKVAAVGVKRYALAQEKAERLAAARLFISSHEAQLQPTTQALAAAIGVLDGLHSTEAAKADKVRRSTAAALQRLEDVLESGVDSIHHLRATELKYPQWSSVGPARPTEPRESEQLSDLATALWDALAAELHRTRASHVGERDPHSGSQHQRHMIAAPA